MHPDRDQHWIGHAAILPPFAPLCSFPMIADSLPPVRHPIARAAAVTALGVALALATGCATSSGAHQQAQSGRTATPAARTPPPSPSPSATGVRPLPVAPGAGSLAQTRIMPSAHGSTFHAMVTDLWLAVTTGRPSLAKPAFFPVAAYKQVKAIYNPAADWRSRLWHEFSLDVRAAHRLLGADARHAKLLRVIVPSADAAWISPGVCYNRIGYWHVAGPRVVYRLRGTVRSFGIASLISWRGVWYVVHFGGVVRPTVGMVDSPAAGAGSPGPPGGC